jgi:hypothetical protein
MWVTDTGFDISWALSREIHVFKFCNEFHTPYMYARIARLYDSTFITQLSLNAYLIFNLISFKVCHNQNVTGILLCYCLTSSIWLWWTRPSWCRQDQSFCKSFHGCLHMDVQGLSSVSLPWTIRKHSCYQTKSSNQGLPQSLYGHFNGFTPC